MTYSSTYILIMSNTHCSLNTLHFLLVPLLLLILHLVKPFILQSLGQMPSPSSSSESLPCMSPYLSSLACYNVFVYILTPWLLCGFIEGRALSNSLRTPSLLRLHHQRQAQLACVERKWVKSRAVFLFSQRTICPSHFGSYMVSQSPFSQSPILIKI